MKKFLPFALIAGLSASAACNDMSSTEEYDDSTDTTPSLSTICPDMTEEEARMNRAEVATAIFDLIFQGETCFTGPDPKPQFDDIDHLPTDQIEAIRCITSLGIIDGAPEEGTIAGYPDMGTFYPERLMNRAEISKIIGVALNLNQEECITNLNSPTPELPCPDIQPRDWYTCHVTTLFNEGLVTHCTPDGNFHPGSDQSRCLMEEVTENYQK